MGMADVSCAYCSHRMSKHKAVREGPTTCTVEGCECEHGPARRDDLVDKIDDLAEAGQALYDMLCNEAGMPDTYQQTDSRMEAWREAKDRSGAVSLKDTTE